MDKEALFNVLSAQDVPILLKLLSSAYDQMQNEQRQALFGQFIERASRVSADIKGETLLVEVETFQQASLNGQYYAPFNMNSRNYSHIPEKTRVWLDKLSDFLTASVQLTAQGDHFHAVACFKILYDLIDAIEEGKEIVFAHELGSWMIPGDEQQFIAAYMTSLAAIATPEEFVGTALPLIWRDSIQSFINRTYSAAVTAATEPQRTYLEREIREQKIRTGHTIG